MRKQTRRSFVRISTFGVHQFRRGLIATDSELEKILPLIAQTIASPRIRKRTVCIVTGRNFACSRSVCRKGIFSSIHWREMTSHH